MIAIGSEIEDKDGIKVGDQVIYKSFSATEVKDEGQEFVIIDLKEVLAVIE